MYFPTCIFLPKCTISFSSNTLQPFQVILLQLGTRAAPSQQAKALLEARPRITGLEGCPSPAVMIVEDDSDGGCSWCPVVTEATKEDEDASVSFWKKGEQRRNVKDHAGAVDYFNRGVVANPRNTACWVSMSEVSQEANPSAAAGRSCPLHFADPIVAHEPMLNARWLRLQDGPDNNTHPGNRARQPKRLP